MKNHHCHSGFFAVVLLLALCCCAVVRAESPSPKELIQQGISETDPAKKVELFEQALQAEPDNPYALNNLATCYFEQGNQAKAQELFRQAISSPKTTQSLSAEIYFGLGDSCLAEKEITQAWKYYQEGLKILPDDEATKKKMDETRKANPQYFDADGNCLFKDVTALKQEFTQTRGAGIKPRALLKIEFAFNSDQILPEYDSQIEALAKALQDQGDSAFTIEGHTDSKGTETYNQKLSERRAEALKKRLSTRHGLSADSLRSKGFGKSKPLCEEKNDADAQRNRRVEVVKERR